MGWELRHGGKWYLYRCRRVGGKPVKEYLAAEGDFGALMAHDLHRLQQRQRKIRRLERTVRAAFRGRVDGLVRAAEGANAQLRVVVEGLLYAVGYHKHRRGEWRMRRELKSLGAMIERLRGQLAEPAPLVRYDPPGGDAEAAEVFAKARAGDAAALDRVRGMIREKNWMDWLGDLGRQATRQLIWQAAGGDRVWDAGITEKANALRRQLLGDAPTALEELLVRRVVNGWVAVHALELEQAVRPPADRADRAHLDRAVSRAQRRMTEAAGELARVRRLQAPQLVAQLNLATSQTVVNGGG